MICTCPTCQRVKAEHGRPAGLLNPLPVPSRRGGTIGLDFLEMPTANSGHDFLQVHIDFLTGGVWLVSNFKTAASESRMPQRRRPGTSSRRSSTMLACPMRWSPTATRALRRSSGQPCTRPWGHRSSSDRHHNTNSRTERVNGVIADVLRSFVDWRHDDWPSLIPLVEFAINNSASRAFPPRPRIHCLLRGPGPTPPAFTFGAWFPSG